MAVGRQNRSGARFGACGADGTLQSIQDLHGNTLTVTTAGITSSTMLSVPFYRDGYHRITRIDDPLGNRYWYVSVL